MLPVYKTFEDGKGKKLKTAYDLHILEKLSFSVVT
jgi:hypothetical protein